MPLVSTIVRCCVHIVRLVCGRTEGRKDKPSTVTLRRMRQGLIIASVIDISPEPASISLTSSPSSSIVAGDIVTLPCTVTLPSGVTDTPVFQWEGPGGVSLTPDDSMTNGQTVSNDLILNDVTTSQAGQYTCNATLSRYITESIIINVQSK